MSAALASHLARIGRDARAAVAVEIVDAKGSTPRAEDAIMLVDLAEVSGTIGGGHLEYHAIDIARTMIEAGARARRETIPLGPMMGQCCGGQVILAFATIDDATARRLHERLAEEAARMRDIFAFGLGHTGRAFARVMAGMPFRTTMIDDRPEAFADLPENARARHCEDPEDALADARPGSAFVIFTHSHSLDYRLADRALRRGDAAYVGMIGSATKRARFASWFSRRGGPPERLARLVCPIGGEGARDKRPEIIALLAAAEIARVFAGAAEPLLPRSRGGGVKRGETEGEALLRNDPPQSPTTALRAVPLPR